MQRNLNFFTNLISIVFSVLVQIVGFVWVLPYIAKNLFFPNKPGENRQTRKERFALKLRKILEFKHANQLIGISLAVLLLFFSVFQVPLSAEVKATSEAEEKIVAEIDSIVTEKSYQVPVIGQISQYFTGYHMAIDYAGNYLASIYPIAEGHVTSIEYGWLGYGNSVIVDHGNGLVSRYAHLHTIRVNLGQEVAKDTIIGLVGSTGWSTGPHLHLETIYKGEKINPLSLME